MKVVKDAASAVAPPRVTDVNVKDSVMTVTHGGATAETRLEATADATYWRSLEALAETDEAKAFLHREFQEGASELSDPMSRRKFLGLMGASMSLAALAGCRKPLETIVPYVKTPEETVIGRPEQYATSAVIAGSVMGLLVTSREGRPIKIDGNELHPSSRGGSNAFAQAEILNLYDPDRSRSVKNRGVDSDWGSFVEFWRSLREGIDGYASRGGMDLAVISGAITSPTLLNLKQQFLQQYPHAHWITYEPLSDDNVVRGIKAATGEALHPRYDYSKAELIVSFDSDFLMMEGESARNALGYAEGRRITEGRTAMNRLYVVESNFSVTGANADHRLRLKSSQIAEFVAGIATGNMPVGLNGEDAKWFSALVKDLNAHKGKCVITAGRSQPAEVHSVVAALNAQFGTPGETVTYFPAEVPANGDPEQASIELRTLGWVVGDNMGFTAIVLGANPVYDAPADLEISNLLKGVSHLIHVGSHFDETAQLAEWHINEAHFLEAWGDAQAIDGTLSVQQPLIEPLFKGKSALEVVSLLTTGVEARGYDLVRETWKNLTPALDFEKNWREVLHDGVLEGSALAGKVPDLKIDAISAASKINSRKEGGLEVTFQPSTSVWDGRYANNGWMQELPDPMTKIVWDNAALISAKTAEKLGVESEDVVKISAGGNSIEAPVFILPGHADDSITLTLGYGRKGLGKVAEGAGFNAYPLRTSEALWVASGVSVQKTGKTYKLATTQVHGSMEGRPIVREGTLEEYKHEPHFAAEMVEQGAAPSLWKEHTYTEGNQWGMTIDLNTCIGCNACTIACQSENNIPIVGKDQVLRGREMHWIRLDRYFTGTKENPQAVTQPVGCQQCEMAPCEQVCPAAATSHDHEGLNVMTYNRCIGTRYCSNNCPYKVRRFNFFNFTSELDKLVQMAQNPDVSVRSRGVMEKCTYCVQRINRGKHNAKMENRDVRDGEITTACEVACPTKAIVFGNINDPESRVSKMKKEERRYDLLAELNTRPRTSYLAKIRNPNPELEKV